MLAVNAIAQRHRAAVELGLESILLATFMRALFMDFLSDPKTWNMGSAYMFGSSFLVAPVLHAQYTPEQAQQILKENEGLSLIHI